ncbi:unnamed protein product [Medioppia subpectinata]|uniref:cAMP-regulated phosphoprotein 19 n=1 Tax=Medioppia subpectinata TaxID=1979941 RepID=A0A7R9Q6H7_9ACAR|nr:unnamed protein product [Medioppia subpectinata]CAG2113871.1 unnamed protein product [Medioppia subpectinata]
MSSDDTIDTNNLTNISTKEEKEEEEKLKAKYPHVQRPGPQFLQKRLQKGQKFFDSGDYNMAKAAAKTSNRLPQSKLSAVHIPEPSAPAPIPTGDTIPTPDCLANRKTSIHVQSKLVSGAP